MLVFVSIVVVIFVNVVSVVLAVVNVIGLRPQRGYFIAAVFVFGLPPVVVSSDVSCDCDCAVIWTRIVS